MPIENAAVLRSDAAEPATTEQASSSGGYGRATLVVCPLVAVLQWRQEIERFTKPNTLKACFFVIDVPSKHTCLRCGLLEEAQRGGLVVWGWHFVQKVHLERARKYVQAPLA